VRTPAAPLATIAELTVDFDDLRVEVRDLYDAGARVEESAGQHRRATDLFAEIGDRRGAGAVRNNLAVSLRRLSRHAEAERAIELKRPLGHAAEPWTPGRSSPALSTTWATHRELPSLVSRRSTPTPSAVGMAATHGGRPASSPP
jgi:hypothetical protein